MSWVHYLFIASALVLLLFIYQLPRSVLTNEPEVISEESTNHFTDFPQKIKNEMRTLKSTFINENNPKKQIDLAYILAKHYLDYHFLDSAIYYGDFIINTQKETSEKAAYIFYTAFQRCSNPEDRKVYANKAKNLIEPLVKKDENNMKWKNWLAMTLVESKNPMSGIALLKDIIQHEPENRLALLNLGLLAVQSRQYEKAKGRFETLLNLNPLDYEAKMHLAVTLMNTGDNQAARILLDEIANAKDTTHLFIKTLSENYLKELEHLNP